MARIILYTGKGGVGKTCLAASTALRAAEMGHRTIVMSTDPAHSLADSFDRGLGPEPTEVLPNLWGQEVDVLHELSKHWEEVQRYLATLLAWRGMDELVAREMTILPGMEELASLLQINFLDESGRYDVIVVDMAPTGETLRLLSFPEVARWWLDHIMPVQRQAVRVLRPVLRIPLPADGFFDSSKGLVLDLQKVHDTLVDHNRSSVRVVLNPEKMVVKEAQRTYTYLNLFNFQVDAVIANRYLPQGITDAYFRTWKETQAHYKQVIEDSFRPLPIFDVPLMADEVVGLDMLRKMADETFGTQDPTQLFFHGRAQTMEAWDGGYRLSLPLPLAEKGNIELDRVEDELVVRVGNLRHNIVLPDSAVRLDVERASLEEGVLRIYFKGEGDGNRTEA